MTAARALMAVLDALALAIVIGGLVVIVILMRKDRPGRSKDGPW